MFEETWEGRGEGHDEEDTTTSRFSRSRAKHEAVRADSGASVSQGEASLFAQVSFSSLPVDESKP